jgi:ribosomal protein S18 acetylase RimI-like enzyme
MSIDAVQPQLGTLSVFELEGSVLDDLERERQQNRDLHCIQVQLTEAALLQQLMEHTGVYSPETVLQRLAAGRTAYMGCVESGEGRHAASFGWVAQEAEPLGATGVAFQPAAGEAYLYDFATAAGFRGRGYYPTLLRFILADLAQQQVRRAWISTAPGNDVSARSIARAGFLQVAATHHILPQHGQPARFELVAMPDVDPALVLLGQRAFISV